MTSDDKSMETMTVARFESLAEAWGGDIGRWPQTQQAAARRLHDADAGARAALADAAKLDALLELDAEAEARPSAALMARVLADAADIAAGRAPVAAVSRGSAPRQGWLARFLGDALRPAAALAFSAALGVAVGVYSPAINDALYGTAADEPSALDYAYGDAALTLLDGEGGV